MAPRAYVHGLRVVLRDVTLPYGYTVTVWSSGQVLIHHRGMPPVWMVFLFAGGAVAAFATLRALTPDPSGETAPQVGSTPHGARAVVIQAGAIGAAVGAAALVGLIPSTVAWPLGGFAATAVYLCGLSVESALRDVETE